MNNNLVLIGMAGAGKSTIGREAAALLGWNFIDVDTLIEARANASLEDISQRLSRDEFLDLEVRITCGLKTRNTVIATGGSIIYRAAGIKHLRGLGPLLFIDVPLPLIIERIKRQPQRGLVREPGQSLEELYHQRRQMYLNEASMRISGGEEPPASYARQVVELVCRQTMV